MYSCGQRTGDATTVCSIHSTFRFRRSGLSSLCTSMGSDYQGRCHSSIPFVFYQKSAVVLLFLQSNVHNNRGGDVIGRYDIYVQTVLLIFFV